MKAFWMGAAMSTMVVGTATAALSDDIVFKGTGTNAAELSARFYIADRNGNMIVPKSWPWEDYYIGISCQRLVNNGPGEAVKDISFFLRNDYSPEQIKQFKPSIVSAAKKAIDACNPNIM